MCASSSVRAEMTLAHAVASASAGSTLSDGQISCGALVPRTKTELPACIVPSAGAQDLSCRLIDDRALALSSAAPRFASSLTAVKSTCAGSRRARMWLNGDFERSQSGKPPTTGRDTSRSRLTRFARTLVPSSMRLYGPAPRASHTSRRHSRLSEATGPDAIAGLRKHFERTALARCFLLTPPSAVEDSFRQVLRECC